MEDENQVKPTAADEEHDTNPQAVEDWPLTVETDDRTAEEAGYGYGV